MVPHESRLGVFISPLLTTLPWVEHGFGGRHAVDWPPVSSAVATRQVHGVTVLHAVAPGSCGEGDALVADVPELFVGVRTADCVPILLADVRQRRVAAVHAGWRGTAAGILTRAVEALGARPADIYAACGPSIGPCCYEVGPEVSERFGRLGRVKLDLAEENRQQLKQLGVPAAQIDPGPVPCTRCGEAHFESYRRDGERAGRMVSAIAIR